jgi:hypothetical protein
VSDATAREIAMIISGPAKEAIDTERGLNSRVSFVRYVKTCLDRLRTEMPCVEAYEVGYESGMGRTHKHSLYFQ